MSKKTRKKAEQKTGKKTSKVTAKTTTKATTKSTTKVPAKTTTRTTAKKATAAPARKAAPKPAKKLAAKKSAKPAATSGRSKSGAKAAPAKPAAPTKAAAPTKPVAAAKSLTPAKSPVAIEPATPEPTSAKVDVTASVKAKPPASPAAPVPQSTAPRLAASSADAGSNQPASKGLTIGGKAPAFTLPRDGGGTVSLASYAGRQLVSFFYPRARTPGCTKEAMDFSRLSADFAALGTDILGVSADPQRAQESFRDKHDLTMPLLSDEAHAMLEAFDAWGEKSLYGRVFHGVLRTTVLIDADGKVINIWRGVRVDGHADAVLEYVRNL